MKPVTIPRPKFGVLLRGTRLGFHWSQRHAAFIRMSGTPDGDILVEVSQGDPFPKERGDRGHTCWAWWESTEVPVDVLLEMCKPLRNVYKPEMNLRFVVNDDGELVK